MFRRTLWILLVCVLGLWAVSGQEGPITTNAEQSCPEGTERGGPQGSACVPCRVGYYRNATHPTSQCKTCPNEYITPAEGATSVQNCTVHVGSRANCPPGTEWVSDNEDCQPCPVGTYRTKGTHFWCLRCPEGRLTPTRGATSIQNCTVEDCPSGTQWNVNNKRCELCPRNSYRKRGEHGPCQECQPYHVTLYRGATSKDMCFELPHSDQLFQVPENCPSGTQHNVVSGVCQLCPKNYFRDEDQHSACQPCPAGHVTVRPGATRSSLCLTQEQMRQLPLPARKEMQCPPGTEWGSYPAGCFACPLGTYRSDWDSRLCHMCPDGLTTPTVGAKTPDLCGEAQVEGNSTIFAQEECSAGTRWQGARRACLVCPQGHFSPDGQLCVPCPVNSTTLYPGASSVRDCHWRTGAHNQQPFFDSDQCPLGSEWDEEAGGCRACPGGLYRDDPAARSCLPCPLSTTTLRPGAKRADLCIAPLEGPTTSPVTQDGCEPGYEISSDNSTCNVCPNGFFKSDEGWGKCQPCRTDARGRRERTNFAGATNINDCLPEVMITELAPTYGPQSGGTEVLVSIDTLLPLRVHSLLLAEYPCRPKNNYFKNGRLVCVTSPARSQAEGPLHMALVSYEGDFISSPKFFYKPEPQIDVPSIKPLKSFMSGGIMLTVRGTNMQSVAKPVLLLKDKTTSVLEKRVEWPCYIMSSGRMECPLPDLTENGERLRRSYFSAHEETHAQEYDVGFRLDGQIKYSNLTKELGAFRIYQDPLVYPLDDNVTAVVEQNGGKLEIKGRRLNLGCNLEDYRIGVGLQCTARLLDLTEDHMMCTVCGGLKQGIKHKIVVKVGSLTFTIGYIYLPTTALHFLVPLLAALGCLILLVIVVVGLCLWQHRRRRVAKSESTQGLTSAEASPSGSISKQSSIESGIPPLPVDSIFGPERLTDKGVAMRPLALPSDGMAVQLVEQTNKGKLLRYNVTFDEAADTRFSALSIDSDGSVFQSQREPYLEILPDPPIDTNVTT